MASSRVVSHSKFAVTTALVTTRCSCRSKATVVRSPRWMPTRNTRFHIAVAHCARWRLNSTRQALYERVGGHWSTQQVALHRVTTELVQQRQLCFGLDAFGDDSDAETVGERDGGLDDGGVV